MNPAWTWVAIMVGAGILFSLWRLIDALADWIEDAHDRARRAPLYDVDDDGLNDEEN